MIESLEDDTFRCEFRDSAVETLRPSYRAIHYENRNMHQAVVYYYSSEINRSHAK
jgi:hypothetical protein